MFINEHIHPRIHEWFYNQMKYWLQYLLNKSDCNGAVYKPFDAMLKQMYINYVDDSIHDIDGNVCPARFTAPACNCLWDVLFNRLGVFAHDYTFIFSAYSAKYGFTTKEQIYYHMIDELDVWIDTINDRNDIITIAFGMTFNINIFDAFIHYMRRRNEDGVNKTPNFYEELLNALEQINFDSTNISIDYWYYIQEMRYSPDVEQYAPQVQQVGDLQSVYSSHITAFCRYLLHNMQYDVNSPIEIPDQNHQYTTMVTIQDCINVLSDFIFGYCKFEPTFYLYKYGQLNNITDKWQILDHIASAIEPYPETLEQILELSRTHRFKFYGMSRDQFTHFTIMTKLIDFDTIPIALINSILEITDIPEYCAKLSKTYRRIKAAKHEEIIND